MPSVSWGSSDGGEGDENRRHRGHLRNVVDKKLLLGESPDGVHPQGEGEQIYKGSATMRVRRNLNTSPKPREAEKTVTGQSISPGQQESWEEDPESNLSGD